MNWGTEARENRDHYARIARDHLKHDLTEQDREALKTAGSRLATFAFLGSASGTGLGLYLGWDLSSRLAAARLRFLEEANLKITTTNPELAAEISKAMRPTGRSVGSMVMMISYGFLGLIVGSELGFWGGNYAGKRVLNARADIERIERAMNRTKVDILRAKADAVERGAGRGREGPSGGGI